MSGQPDNALGYSSGAGNGPFGFGWSLDTPAALPAALDFSQYGGTDRSAA